MSRIAEWLADLLRHGLLRASFIPARASAFARPHPLSDPPRRRTRATHQPAADGAGGCQYQASSKLASVVTDVRGLSAREILQRLLEGETDAQALAELARGKLRAKREALAQAVVGRLQAHHVFLLREQLAHLDYLDAAIARLDTELTARLADEQEAMALLQTIPGVARRTAEVLLPCSSPRSAATSRTSLRLSISPPGRGCALAMRRVAAVVSVGGRAAATLGCGARWLKSRTLSAA